MGRTRGAVWFGSPLQTIKGQAAEELVLFFFISLAFVQGCVLKDGDSLPRWQAETMGGRLALCAGGFFSAQMILLEHRLREEKAGVGVSSGREGGGTGHQDLAWYRVQNLKHLLFHTEVLGFSRGPGGSGIQAHIVEEAAHVE